MNKHIGSTLESLFEELGETNEVGALLKEKLALIEKGNNHVRRVAELLPIGLQLAAKSGKPQFTHAFGSNPKSGAGTSTK